MYKHFTQAELACKCCGRHNFNPDFHKLMSKVDTLRAICGFPFVVSSAYRCKDHPKEAAKPKPGYHNHAAIDIRVSYDKAHILLKEALIMGFTGIGVSQKGDAKYRFIHLDLCAAPTVWSY